MRAIPRTAAALAIAVIAAACESSGTTDPKLTFARMSLEQKAISLGVDDEFRLKVASNPDGSPITWKSVDPGVAVVSTSGVVSGRNMGVTQVIAAARRSTDTATITVRAPLTMVVLNPESLSVAATHSVQLSFKGIDKNGQTVTDFSSSNVKWASNRNAIATVSSAGVVKALSAGRAVITLTVNGKSDSTQVDVSPAPIAAVLVTPSPTANVGKGKWLQLSSTVRDSGGGTQALSVNWTSSDTNVATVSTSGVVTAKNFGTATINASVNNIVGGTAVTIVAPTVKTVTVALNSNALQGGQTTQAVAAAKDSLGSDVTGRTVVWSSSNTAVATVSPAGLVTAVGAGTTDIVATVDGIVGSSTLSVTAASVSAVSVVLGSSSILAGTTTQATASATDALGNVITGRTVAWSSSNTAIATVANGVVTAVAGGTASITATVDGVAGSATLVVTRPTVASITVASAATSLAAGQTAQATATVYDVTGTPVSIAVTWTSSAPTVATVSSTGLITAVASGTASITATAGGTSGSVPMTVQGTSSGGTSSPTGGTHIPLTVQRFDGASGNVTVSNAIPLAPGLLTTSGVASVRLFVNGTEQSVYLEPLTALHADGSLRSILVQFNYNLTPTPVQGELIIGQTPVSPRLTKPSVSRSAPNAVALPSDANYLVSTELMGPSVTSATSRSWGGTYAKMESDFGQWSDYHWQNEGSNWGDNYYDRAAIYYQMWARTANPEYWRRGTLHALAYRTSYIEPNNYASSAYWLMDEGLALHYLATGDQSSWFAVGRLAQQFVGCVHPNPNCYVGSLTGYMDLRDQARVLQSLFLAWRLKSPGDPAIGSFDWAAELATGTDAVLSTQQADGSYKSQMFCFGFAPYQLGILNDQLIKQYRYFRADSRIVTSVQKAVAYLWANEWIDSANGFKYNSVECQDNGMGTNVGGTGGAPDLTGMLSLSFAWVAKQTGSATDASIFRTVYGSAVNTAYLIGSKQFNQAFETSTLSLGLIAP